MKPIFTGTIKANHLIADEKDVFELYISQFEGQKVDVSVEKHKSSRTMQQNKYLWGAVYKTISDEIGYTEEEIHQLLKTLFLKKHLDVKEKRYVIIGSTAQLNTKEFTDYVEKIKVWASSELNIVIPDADKIDL